VEGAATMANPDALRPGRPRKAASEDLSAPVPQTDTGGQVEHTEVDGRPSVKELGNFAP
jgi:hypothetical protein